jgi:hypothetical protein
MKKRAFTFLAIISLLFCLILLLLWPLSYLEYPSDELAPPMRLTLFNDVRIAVSRGHMYLYNGEAPYLGSIISVGEDPHLRTIEWGSSKLFYFRYFEWPDRHWMTVGTTVFCLMLLTGILPFVWLVQWTNRRNKPTPSPPQRGVGA